MKTVERAPQISLAPENTPQGAMERSLLAEALGPDQTGYDPKANAGLPNATGWLQTPKTGKPSLGPSFYLLGDVGGNTFFATVPISPKRLTPQPYVSNSNHKSLADALRHHAAQARQNAAGIPVPGAIQLHRLVKKISAPKKSYAPVPAHAVPPVRGAGSKVSNAEQNSVSVPFFLRDEIRELAARRGAGGDAAAASGLVRAAQGEVAAPGRRAMAGRPQHMAGRRAPGRPGIDVVEIDAIAGGEIAASRDEARIVVSRGRARGEDAQAAQ